MLSFCKEPQRERKGQKAIVSEGSCTTYSPVQDTQGLAFLLSVLYGAILQKITIWWRRACQAPRIKIGGWQTVPKNHRLHCWWALAGQGQRHCCSLKRQGMPMAPRPIHAGQVCQDAMLVSPTIALLTVTGRLTHPMQSLENHSFSIFGVAPTSNSYGSLSLALS